MPSRKRNLNEIWCSCLWLLVTDLETRKIVDKPCWKKTNQIINLQRKRKRGDINTSIIETLKFKAWEDINWNNRCNWNDLNYIVYLLNPITSFLSIMYSNYSNLFPFLARYFLKTMSTINRRFLKQQEKLCSSTFDCIDSKTRYAKHLCL